MQHSEELYQPLLNAPDVAGEALPAAAAAGGELTLRESAEPAGAAELPPENREEGLAYTQAPALWSSASPSVPRIPSASSGLSASVGGAALSEPPSTPGSPITPPSPRSPSSPPAAASPPATPAAERLDPAPASSSASAWHASHGVACGPHTPQQGGKPATAGSGGAAAGERQAGSGGGGGDGAGGGFSWRSTIPATAACTACLFMQKGAQQGYLDGVPLFSAVLYGWGNARAGLFLASGKPASVCSESGVTLPSTLPCSTRED